MISGLVSHVEEGPGGDYPGPFLHIRSEAPLRTLNSSVWGGGFGCHRHLVNRHVPKSYDCSDPAGEMERFLSASGIPPQDTCAMLTAADVRNCGYARASHNWSEYGESVSLEVSAWVTAGLGNTCRAGDVQPMEKLFPGTVNIIVAVNARLADPAMAGAIITATEAKTAAFQELGIIVAGTDRPATGTTTDAVLIAAADTGRREFAYAGSATIPGHLIGRTVYEACVVACSRYLAKYPQFALRGPNPAAERPRGGGWIPKG